MKRKDGLPRRKGVRHPLPPSPMQAALLAQLRAGWVLKRSERWDDYFKVHPAHPRAELTVNTQTARSLVTHKYVVETARTGGFITYAVNE